jgi:hypothetical protein
MCALAVFGAGGASAAKLVLSGGDALSSGASATSVANDGWGAGVEAVLPANASTSPIVFIDSVSCPSAGNCSAVGQYADSSGAREGLLLTETAGRWGAGVEAALPANAETTTSQFAPLDSVSCASAGNCTAVGEYTDGSGSVRGLLLTETAGSWGTGVEAVVPANAAPNAGARLSSVTCASAGNCSAVGSYLDSSGSVLGLLLTETTGTWGAGVEAPLPANAAAAPLTEASLSAVSCASPGNCDAVGYYVDSSRSCQGLLLTETNGTWATGIEALPANAIGCAVTFAVSCPSAGNCTANLGDYLLTEAAGSWATVGKPVLPANACPVGPGPGQCDGNYGGANSISCTSARNCSAVGDYTDSSGDEQGLLLTETAGGWRAGVEAPRASNATGGSLTSVSCASRGNCSAVGNYGNTGSGIQGIDGLLLTKAGGKWAAVEAALLANAAGEHQNRFVELSSVSCASAGRCSAVGSYTDSSGNYHGLLLDSHSLPLCVVPKLKGKTLVAARRSIKSHACSVGRIKHAASQTIKKGRVISQKPKPRLRLQHGARVNLVVSEGRR